MKAFLCLLGFEVKKNFASPCLLVFLAALLLVNGWQLKQKYARATAAVAGHEALYEEFYSRWNGPITPEKIGDVMAIYGPLREKDIQRTISYHPGSGTYLDTEFADFLFFGKQFAQEMEYDYLYGNRAMAICRNAQLLEEVFREAGNGYALAKAEAAGRAFAGRQIPNFADTRYLEVWLNHDFSSLLVLLMCLFGLGTVFVTERETGMYMLQRTARFGGSTTVAAKLTASTVYMLVVCLLFYAQDFGVLQLLSGHREALGSPVYAIPPLRTTRLNMSVGEFVLWLTAVKTLGILACGWGILLLSCLCRRVLSVYIASIGSIAALSLLQEYALLRPGLKWFNPMELLLGRELVWNATYVNLLGKPVALDIFVLLGTAAVLGSLFGAVLWCNPGKAERRRRGCCAGN